MFTLLASESLHEASEPVETLLATATWTILLSVLAHGLSAAPISAWFARRLEAAEPPLAELVEMPELRRRSGVLSWHKHG